MTFETGARAVHEPKIKLYHFQIYEMLERQTLQQRTGIMVTRPFW